MNVQWSSRGRLRRWMGGMAVTTVAAAALVLGGQRPAMADCFVPGWATVCACNQCTYSVLCSFQFGIPPFLGISFCTGNTPPMTVAWAISGSSGKTSTSTSIQTCGRATLTGQCCGGARTTVDDFSLTQTKVPSGASCGSPGSPI